jgi:hypothetical protein
VLDDDPPFALPDAFGQDADDRMINPGRLARARTGESC